MSLRQDGDAMFERNIAIIASRKQEVLIDSDGVIYEGFLCGLDEEWLQIYGHDQEDREHPHLSWRFVLINRNRINSISDKNSMALYGLSDGNRLESSTRRQSDDNFLKFMKILKTFRKMELIAGNLTFFLIRL